MNFDGAKIQISCRIIALKTDVAASVISFLG